MKKVYCMTTTVVFAISVSVPLMSMGPSKLLVDNSNVVLFTGELSVVPVEKSNLPLIKALYPEYKKHKVLADKGGIVPSLEHVSVAGLPLVNAALKVRPDEFAAYYTNLPIKDRILLIKASGQYDDKGNRTMLNVPEVTKRLIDVYFTNDVLRAKIKSYFKDEDEADVRRYFKEKLISCKGLLTLKQPMTDTYKYQRIRKDIYLGSFFINASHIINQDGYPVFLRIGDTIRKTYATQFGSDNYEYRITDKDDNQCLLWVVNHNNPSRTFSTLIKLANSIKGCRLSRNLSRTNTDTKYALIFSEYDMVLSTIMRDKQRSYVLSASIKAPKDGIIVDVCFEPITHGWIVGFYKGLASVFRRLYSNGRWSNIENFLLFKREGLLEKIGIYRGYSNYYFIAVMAVANLRAAIGYISQRNGKYEYLSSTGLQPVRKHASSFLLDMVNVEGSIHIFDDLIPFFRKNVVEQEEKRSTESEVHRVYSPTGEFLMHNSLKRELGKLFVETVLKDAVTHKKIISFDTLYSRFVGVGFTPDGTELIFINNVGPHDKVILLNDKDRQMLYEMEKVAFTNSGVTSLLKRLCRECEEKGIISLHENDSTCSMLIDWAKFSPAMLKILQKCLPVRKIKKW